MRETSLRDKFREIVTRFPGHVTNHEDKFIRGVFDASYVFRDNGNAMSGWVEFKHVPQLPRRITTPLDIGLRKEQVLWSEDRMDHGETMFMMVRVADTIYVFSASYARRFYEDRVTQTEMESLWIGKWQRSIDSKELRDILCGR